MMEIRRASELGVDIRPQLSSLFVDSFGQWLTYFSKDKDKLKRAFSHAFVLDAFFVAIVNGKVAGMAAVTDGVSPSMKLNGTELRRHLGFITGSLAHKMLYRELENHPYPFKLLENECSLEFVAVSQAHRGEGIAFAILSEIFERTAYASYVLEAADTNLPAVTLYKKLGFEEFCRVKVKHTKHSGINALVYMRCNPNKKAGYVAAQ